MRPSFLTVLSWFAVGSIVVLGAGWWYLSGILGSALDVYGREALAAQQAAAAQAAAVRVSELLQSTAGARAQLAAVTAIDTLSAVKMIESVGKIASVELSVNGVSSDNNIISTQKNSAPVKSPLNTMLFSFKMKGTLAHILRAVELLDALSLPAIVDELDISRDTSSAGANSASGVWTAAGRIRFLTSMPLTP